MICELCEDAEANSKHHLVPRNVVAAINKSSKVKDHIINLCKHCHGEVHFAFLHHLIMMQKVDGYNRQHALAYPIMKGWLKNKNKKIWAKWKIYWKSFIEVELEEFSKEQTLVKEIQ